MDRGAILFIFRDDGNEAATKKVSSCCSLFLFILYMLLDMPRPYNCAPAPHQRPQKMSSHAGLPNNLQAPWPEFVKHDPHFIPQSMIHPLRPLPKYERELSVALQAVHLASILTKIHLLRALHLAKTSKGSGRVDEVAKADSSEVTVADFAAQAIIIGIVNAAFPDDHFIAEESAEMLRGDDELRRKVMGLVLEAKAMIEASSIDSLLPTTDNALLEVIDLGQKGGKGNLRQGSRSWILDPIDGTKTYIRGQQYAVCLCLVEEGEQRVAVLGCPNLNLEDEDRSGRIVVDESTVNLKVDGGYLLSAIKGRGAFISYMNNCCLPETNLPLQHFLQHGFQAKGNKVTKIEAFSMSNPSNRLAFTDSSASSHTNTPVHNAIFKYFDEHINTNGSEQATKHVSNHVGGSALRDIWSMQMKYVVLTLQAADAMIRLPPQNDYHAAVWDHAGGQLLLTESGGHLTDGHGKPFVLDGKTRRLEQNWGVCATRGGKVVSRNHDQATSKEVHAMVLEKVSEELNKYKTNPP